MEKRIGYQKTIIWVEGAYRKLTSALPQLSEFDTFSDDPLNLHYRGFGWKESLIYAKSIVDNRRERQLSVFKCSGVLDINLIYITLLGEFLFKRKMLAGSFVLIKQETSLFGIVTVLAVF